MEASGGIQGSYLSNNAKCSRWGPLYLLLSRSLSAFVQVEYRFKIKQTLNSQSVLVCVFRFIIIYAKHDLRVILYLYLFQ